MDKYFPAFARHVKGWEFFELRQGMMTTLEYVAKFIELARFADDYVATYMAKVRRFEDGMKLSIWGKLVGLFMQDLDSMVRTAMAIEREVDDARNIWDATVVKDKRRESQPSSSSLEIRRGLIFCEGFKDRVAVIRAKARSGLLASLGRGHVTTTISLDT